MKAARLSIRAVALAATLSACGGSQTTEREFYTYQSTRVGGESIWIHKYEGEYEAVYGDVGIGDARVSVSAEGEAILSLPNFGFYLKIPADLVTGTPVARMPKPLQWAHEGCDHIVVGHGISSILKDPPYYYVIDVSCKSMKHLQRFYYSNTYGVHAFFKGELETPGDVRSFIARDGYMLLPHSIGFPSGASIK